MQSNRGKIINRDRARQILDFNDLCFGTITPTNIDGIIEYHNKAYIIIEEKFGNGELKDGQILALKRLTDDLERSGKPTLCIIASHNISNCNDDVDVAKTIVISYRIKNEWIIPPNSITVKELIVWFLSKIKN